MEEAVKKCLEMGGWRFMPHLRLKGAVSGRPPGLPFIPSVCRGHEGWGGACPCELQAAVLGISRAGLSQAGLVLFALGVPVPARVPLLTALPDKPGVCVLSRSGWLLPWEEGLWNMKGFSWKPQSALGRVREWVSVHPAGRRDTAPVLCLGAPLLLKAEPRSSK